MLPADLVRASTIINHQAVIDLPTGVWVMFWPANPLRLFVTLDYIIDFDTSFALNLFTNGGQPVYNPTISFSTFAQSGVGTSPVWDWYGTFVNAALWLFNQGTAAPGIEYGWSEIVLISDPCAKTPNLQPNTNADNVWNVKPTPRVIPVTQFDIPQMSQQITPEMQALFDRLSVEQQ